MARPRSFDEAAVLDRAVGVFWRQGYEGAAIADLCRATRLNPGSIYTAFGDKRGLFVAALRRYADNVSAGSIAVLDGSERGGDAIRAYFSSLVDAMTSGPRRNGCLLTNTLIEQYGADGTIASIITRHLTNLEAAFVRSLLREGTDASEAAERAAGLVCFVQGLNVVAKSRPGRARLEALVSSALGAFVPPPAHGRR